MLKFLICLADALFKIAVFMGVVIVVTVITFMVILGPARSQDYSTYNRTPNNPPFFRHSHEEMVYDPLCCNDHDCFPLLPGEWKEVEGGYYISPRVNGNQLNMVIPYSKKRQSANEFAHLCLSPNFGVVYCFYAPTQGY